MTVTWHHEAHVPFPPERKLVIETPNGYVSTWRAAPDGDGTRLSVDGRVEARGPKHLMLALLAPFARSRTEMDFNGHVEDLKETLSKG